MADRSATAKAQQSSLLGGDRPDKCGFARFKRLPAELRARIWREAILADETLYPSTNRPVMYKIVDVIAKDGTRQTYIVHDQLSARVRQSSVANSSAEACNETWTTACNFPQPVVLDYCSFLCSEEDGAQLVKRKFRYLTRVSLPGKTPFLGPRTEFPLTKGPVDVVIDVAKVDRGSLTDPNHEFEYAKGEATQFADKENLVEVLGRVFGTGLRQLSLYNSNDAIEIHYWSSCNITEAPIRNIDDNFDGWIDVSGRSYYWDPKVGYCLSPIDYILHNAVKGLFPCIELKVKPSLSTSWIHMTEMSLSDASLAPIDVYLGYELIDMPAWYAEVLRLGPNQKSQAVGKFLARRSLQNTAPASLVLPKVPKLLADRCLRELEDLATLLSTHFASFRWISYLLGSIPNRIYASDVICQGQANLKSLGRYDFRNPIRTVRCGDCGKKRFHFTLQQPQYPEDETGCSNNEVQA